MRRLVLLLLILLVSTGVFAFGGKRTGVVWPTRTIGGVDSYGIYIGGEGQVNVKFSCEDEHASPDRYGICRCKEGYDEKNNEGKTVCVKKTCVTNGCTECMSCNLNTGICEPDDSKSCVSGVCQNGKCFPAPQPEEGAQCENVGESRCVLGNTNISTCENRGRCGVEYQCKNYGTLVGYDYDNVWMRGSDCMRCHEMLLTELEFYETKGCPCRSGETKCDDDGQYYTCENGDGTWTDKGYVIGKCGTVCVNGAQKCEKGSYYKCEEGKWLYYDVCKTCPSDSSEYGIGWVYGYQLCPGESPHAEGEDCLKDTQCASGKCGSNNKCEGTPSSVTCLDGGTKSNAQGYEDVCCKNNMSWDGEGYGLLNVEACGCPDEGERKEIGDGDWKYEICCKDNKSWDGEGYNVIDTHNCGCPDGGEKKKIEYDGWEDEVCCKDNKSWDGEGYNDVNLACGCPNEGIKVEQGETIYCCKNNRSWLMDGYIEVIPEVCGCPDGGEKKKSGEGDWEQEICCKGNKFWYEAGYYGVDATMCGCPNGGAQSDVEGYEHECCNAGKLYNTENGSYDIDAPEICGCPSGTEEVNGICCANDVGHYRGSDGKDYCCTSENDAEECCRGSENSPKHWTEGNNMCCADDVGEYRGSDGKRYCCTSENDAEECCRGSENSPKHWTEGNNMCCAWDVVGEYRGSDGKRYCCTSENDARDCCERQDSLKHWTEGNNMCCANDVGHYRGSDGKEYCCTSENDAEECCRGSENSPKHWTEGNNMCCAWDVGHYRGSDGKEYCCTSENDAEECCVGEEGYRWDFDNNECYQCDSDGKEKNGEVTERCCTKMGGYLRDDGNGNTACCANGNCEPAPCSENNLTGCNQEECASLRLEHDNAYGWLDNRCYPLQDNGCPSSELGSAICVKGTGINGYACTWNSEDEQCITPVDEYNLCSYAPDGDCLGEGEYEGFVYVCVNDNQNECFAVHKAPYESGDGAIPLSLYGKDICENSFGHTWDDETQLCVSLNNDLTASNCPLDELGSVICNAYGRAHGETCRWYEHNGGEYCVYFPDPGSCPYDTDGSSYGKEFCESFENCVMTKDSYDANDSRCILLINGCPDSTGMEENKSACDYFTQDGVTYPCHWDENALENKCVLRTCSVEDLEACDEVACKSLEEGFWRGPEGREQCTLNNSNVVVENWDYNDCVYAGSTLWDFNEGKCYDIAAYAEEKNCQEAQLGEDNPVEICCSEDGIDVAGGGEGSNEYCCINAGGVYANNESGTACCKSNGYGASAKGMDDKINAVCCTEFQGEMADEEHCCASNGTDSETWTETETCCIFAGKDWKNGMCYPKCPDGSDRSPNPETPQFCCSENSIQAFEYSGGSYGSDWYVNTVACPYCGTDRDPGTHMAQDGWECCYSAGYSANNGELSENCCYGEYGTIKQDRDGDDICCETSGAGYKSNGEYEEACCFGDYSWDSDNNECYQCNSDGTEGDEVTDRCCAERGGTHISNEAGSACCKENGLAVAGGGDEANEQCCATMNADYLYISEDGGKCVDPCTIGEHANFESTTCIIGHHAENGECKLDYADKGTEGCDADHPTYVCDGQGVCTETFKGKDGNTYLCSDISNVTAEKADCDTCKTTEWPRFSSGVFNECRSCFEASAFYIGTSTDDDVKCAETCPSRIVVKDYQSTKRYCAPKECAEDQYRNYAGSCFDCSSSDNPLTSASSCAQCDNTPYPRFTSEGINSRSCYSCANENPIATTASACSRCTQTPRFMGSDDKCYPCSYADGVTTTDEACAMCPNIRTYNAETGMCELCPEDGCPSSVTGPIGCVDGYCSAIVACESDCYYNRCYEDPDEGEVCDSEESVGCKNNSDCIGQTVGTITCGSADCYCNYSSTEILDEGMEEPEIIVQGVCAPLSNSEKNTKYSDSAMSKLAAINFCKAKGSKLVSAEKLCEGGSLKEIYCCNMMHCELGICKSFSCDECRNDGRACDVPEGIDNAFWAIEEGWSIGIFGVLQKTSDDEGRARAVCE